MPIEELYEPTGPDHDCICEDADKRLFNPDCYWHGTEGVEIEDATPAKPAEPDLLPPATATELASRFDALFKPDNELVEDSEARCEICGWSLAADRSQGCVPGDCSYRPSEGSDEWRRIKARREALAAKPAEGSKS